MAQPFKNAVMTNLGIKLLNDAQAGECSIEFTRIAVGDGSYSAEEKERASLETMEALKHEKETYSILSKKKQNDNAIVLTTNISNYDDVEEKAIVTEGFYINEIAVFARPKGTEDEVMYSIAVVSGELGDYMPPYNGYNPAQIIQSYLVSVNNADDAKIVVQSGAYALQKDLEECQSELNKLKFSEMTELLASVEEGDEFIVNDGGETKRVKASLLSDSLVKLFATSGGAGLHNSLYRGKNLGASFTDEQKAQVAAGTFDDMWIGDYWVIGDVTWRIAHFDYWLHCGDTECTKHHVVIVPDTCLYTAKMNDTNITTGAYVGSAMYTANLAAAKTTIENAFGSANILTHREHLANATKATADPTYESAGSWYDSTVELMNECMVYGSNIYHNVEVNGAIPVNYTIDKSQLALFRLDPSKICNRAYLWLRDVVSAACFALVNDTGSADSGNASFDIGVRPAFAITA